MAWLLGILFFLPIAWMALTSFHSEEDAATNPPSFAAPLTLDGYREFFGAGGGATLQFLASVVGARAVAEVGTGTGVSGLWLLRGMAPDGVLTTIAGSGPGPASPR